MTDGHPFCVFVGGTEKLRGGEDYGVPLAASLEAAIEWALRAPTGLGFDDVFEIRQLTGEDDIPPELVELVKKAAPTWSATFTKPR